MPTIFNLIAKSYACCNAFLFILKQAPMSCGLERCQTKHPGFPPGASSTTQNNRSARQAPEAVVHLARLFQLNDLLELFTQRFWVVSAGGDKTLEGRATGLQAVPFVRYVAQTHRCLRAARCI
jgi:hypothetical protein